METYEKFKKWLEKNKDKFFYGCCFVLVFLLGFGAGRFEKGSRRETLRTNYTTNKQAAPAKNFFENTPANPTTTLTSIPIGNCLIKGNISTGGKKIYHIPGGASYKIVKPEQCFNTESEAQAAGFVKSGK